MMLAKRNRAETFVIVMFTCITFGSNLLILPLFETERALLRRTLGSMLFTFSMAYALAKLHLYESRWADENRLLFLLFESVGIKIVSEALMHVLWFPGIMALNYVGHFIADVMGYVDEGTYGTLAMVWNWLGIYMPNILHLLYGIGVCYVILSWFDVYHRWGLDVEFDALFGGRARSVDNMLRHGELAINPAYHLPLHKSNFRLRCSVERSRARSRSARGRRNR